MSTNKQQTLQFGQRVLWMTGLYAGSFIASYSTSVWGLMSETPLSALSDLGAANSNFMLTTSFWVGLSSIVLSKSNDYQTVKRALLLNAFGFAMWFTCDVYHYLRAENTYTKLFYFGVVPFSVASMLACSYAAYQMDEADDTQRK
mmetsp:Transcript_54661/g.87365  ORF Transcript_54661/g.87365 Transcript_54661/m.87365 type:complete len:145 (+) Transcript_54661:49-483(+)